MGFLPWLNKEKKQEGTPKEEEQEGTVTYEVSVFEFGPTVSAGGSLLKGLCTGDNPDAIQACSWVVEKNQGGKKLKYKVEF
jgi:hypothetical protein